MESNNLECTFCRLRDSREVALENDLAFAIFDDYPVTQGHVLIIPKRHFPNFFDIAPDEHQAVFDLLTKLRAKLLADDDTIDGFNIGVNAGESAGQTVPHCHIHLIPRRTGDIEDPRGGVRGVIPVKRIY